MIPPMRRLVFALTLLLATPALAQGLGPIARLEQAHDAYMASLPTPLGADPLKLWELPAGQHGSPQWIAYRKAIADASAWSGRADAADLLPRKGLWLRPYLSDMTHLEVLKVLDDAQSLGITDLFLETFWGGQVIFPGDPTFPDRYPGIDLLAMYVKEAHRRGIKVHAWLHTLDFGPDWASAHPDTMVLDGFGDVSGAIEKGSNFVSPALPEVRAQLDRLVDELASHSVDGVMLNYLRYPARLKGDDIDETPDPRLYFGYNARQMAAMEKRHPEFASADFQTFLKTGQASPSAMQQVDLDRFKDAMSEDLTGLIDFVRSAVHGRMSLDAAYTPDYYFHVNDSRVQESRKWADRFDLLAPECYEYYLDDYPAPFGTYTINRALGIADGSVADLPTGTRPPVVMPTFTTDVPGTAMSAPFHHQTLRAQTAFLKGRVFDRAFPHIDGVAYFSYGWIFTAEEARRKAGE